MDGSTLMVGVCYPCNKNKLTKCFETAKTITKKTYIYSLYIGIRGYVIFPYHNFNSYVWIDISSLLFTLYFSAGGLH